MVVVSHPPLSLPLSHLFPAPYPQQLHSHPHPPSASESRPGDTARMATMPRLTVSLGGSLPHSGLQFPLSVQEERGEAPGSPVIHHCHRHPSMEQVLIEMKGGDGELPFAGHQLGVRSCPIWDREQPFPCVRAEAQRGRRNL